MTTFNLFASEYEAWYKTALGSFVDEVESKLAFDSIKITPDMKVLDVGCGTGIYTSRLVEKGCQVTGIDISDKMLEIAKGKMVKAKFINSSVYSLPFPDDFFDMVFSMATFEFIHDAKAAYFEMKRVAKPGAQIFIGTINGDSSWGEFYQSEELKEKTVFIDSHFKNPLDFAKLDKDCLISKGACVYFSPNCSEDMLNWENEKKLSKTERPGFITAVWKKNA